MVPNCVFYGTQRLLLAENKMENDPTLSTSCPHLSTDRSLTTLTKFCSTLTTYLFSLVMSSSWNFPARAKLGHFDFRAETELKNRFSTENQISACFLVNFRFRAEVKKVTSHNCRWRASHYGKNIWSFWYKNLLFHKGQQDQKWSSGVPYCSML